MKATAATAGSVKRKVAVAQSTSGTDAKAPARPAVGSGAAPAAPRKSAALASPSTSASPKGGARPAARAATDGLTVEKVTGSATGPQEPGSAPKPTVRAKTSLEAKPAAEKPAPKATGSRPSAGVTAPASTAGKGPAAAETLSTSRAASSRGDAAEGPPLAARTERPGPAPVVGAAPRPAAVRSPGLAAPPQAPAPVSAATQPPAAAARPPQQSGRPIPPPRPLAKAETFVEGDHVVYPTHGVGKVERIAVEEIAGHKLELIHITFEENRMTLRVPVAKARTAGLRKLATRSMFDEALAVLKGKARIKRTMWSRRAQEYEAKINSGDPLAIAEVVRDLHRNAGQPDQSFSERQIYEAAMDRLAAELAALDQTDKPTAAIKLAEFLKTV